MGTLFEQDPRDRRQIDTDYIDAFLGWLSRYRRNTR